MFRCKPIVLLSLCAVVLIATAARADSVEKKWRFGLSVGGFNAQDEVESSSANEMFTLNPCLRTSTCPASVDRVIEVFRDPRSDSQVFGNLDINPAEIGTLSVQYGLSKIFVIEGSIGYQKGDVGDIEVSVQLPGAGPEDVLINPFNFLTQRISVGELELVPIQLSAMARLRPRATFNPYFGAGIGYSIVGFDVSPELDALSQNMDASRGRQLRVTPAFSASGSGTERLVGDNLPQVDLQGATVDARDTFEWHLVGGAEFTLKKRWSLFLDLRWVDASRSLAVGFNGTDELGNSLPDYSPYADSPLASARYGASEVGGCIKDTSGGPGDQNGNPVLCTGGGLIDFGRLTVVRAPAAPATIDCTDPSDIQTPNCIFDFVFEPDGVPDPGLYYVVGGDVDYDGFGLQFGVRFTLGK